MLRNALVLMGALALAACTNPEDSLNAPVEPLGNFKLGLTEVVAPNLQKLLVSRDATQDEWIAEIDTALDQHFGRFDGDTLYNFGVSVEAYSLPPPVIPGKSAVALRVTVWDDAAQTKLNEKTEVIQVIRLFESRLAHTRETQMRALALDAAREIEKWMREQQEAQGWFGGLEANARFAQPVVPDTAEPETPDPDTTPEVEAVEPAG